jgi:hypothetical protein
MQRIHLLDSSKLQSTVLTRYQFMVLVQAMSLGPRAWPPIATLNFCDRMDIDGSRPGVFKYILMQFNVLLTHCTSYAWWCNAWSAIAYDYSISEQLVKLNKLQQLLLQLPISKL